MRLHTGTSLCRGVLVLAVCLAAVNLLAIGLRFQGLVIVGAGIVAWRRLRRWQGSGDSHGTARAASFADLLHHGLFGSSGLIVGTCGYMQPPTLAMALRALFSPLSSPLACRLFLAAFNGRRWCHEIIIRIPSYVHLAVFAPTGSGKGVSFLIPTMLSYKHSTVTVDPQGSIYTVTAEHRKRELNNRSVRLDCFGVCGKSHDGLNPMDFIDARSPDALDQCRDLANMLVVRAGTETDPYWNDQAEHVLTVFIYYVALAETDPARRNLLAVRAIISSRDAYLATLNVMRGPDAPDLLRRLGDSLSWLQEKELNSVLSSVQRHTEWMDSPAVADSLRSSSFDPRELRSSRLSVYLILPPERLVTMAPLLRVTMGTIIRVITRGKASEKNPVLFLIDEAAHIGRVQVLEDAVTLMRGYGIRLWFFYQSIGQLQKIYGDNAQTILENLGTQIYFCVNGLESLETLSKTIGDCTIQVQSINETTSTSHPTGSSGGQPQAGSTSTSTAVTTSETGRHWAMPDELRTMPADLGVIFHKNLRMMIIRLLRYYETPIFKDGNTGESGGVGRAGGIAAATALVVSLLLCAVVACLPAPPRPRPAAASPAMAMRQAQLSAPAPAAPSVPLGNRKQRAAARRRLYWQGRPLPDPGPWVTPGFRRLAGSRSFP